MSADMASRRADLNCEETAEMAGLYVLGALDGDDERRVAEHLERCTEPHAEFAELGGVVPALASLPEPLDAPPELKARVMDAYRSDTSASSGAAAAAPGVSAATARPAAPTFQTRTETKVWEMSDAPVQSAPRPAAQRAWLGWAATALALVLVAVVGAWGLSAQARADREAQRAATMAEALQVLGGPDSEVALLRGSGDAANASGFAAFSPQGQGYVVVTGLPALASDLAYQAWYLIDGTPVSAGLMEQDESGVAVLSRIQHRAGTDVIALTREAAGGADAPTSAPIVAGELRPAQGAARRLEDATGDWLEDHVGNQRDDDQGVDGQDRPIPGGIDELSKLS